MFSAEQIEAIAELDAKHARERAQLAGRHANERVELAERHQRELRELQERIEPAAAPRPALVIPASSSQVVPASTRRAGRRG
jgi:hypothetical protein